MRTAPVLYLLVGLPAAGKTTRAREIERDHRALRLTADEWIISLFGHEWRDIIASGRRDLLEGRLIWVALRALQAGASVVLDYGFWSRDERSALVWLARAVGARASVVYLPIDEATQLARIGARWCQAPDTTFDMSVQDLAGWRTQFEAPTADELAGEVVPPPPAEYETWSAWASARWPSLPLLDDLRL
jgi:predicted kinase